MQKEMVQIMKVKDIMESMGIGRDKAYAIMRAPGFPSMQIGSTYFVMYDKYVEWLTQYSGREFQI